MTQIVVASRDGILRAPDGTQYRMVRGRTLADARHPAVQASPNDFMPVEVELTHDEPETEQAEDLVEVRAEADGYRAQLAAIHEGLSVRGVIPADLDISSEGWLANLIFTLVDRQPAAPAVTEDEPAPAPRPARKSRGSLSVGRSADVQ